MSLFAAVPAPVHAQDLAFVRALDRTAVAALVQEHLAHDATVTELQPDYVRWKDLDGSLLGYRATVRHDGDQHSTYVTVRTAPAHRLADEAERLRHREDEDHAGLRALALVPQANLLLLAFPIDRAMHDLRRLVRASKVRSLLASACPEFVPAEVRFSKSRSRFTLVRYKPERRAVLQWQVGMVDDAGNAAVPRPVWIRCHAEAQGQRTAMATTAAATAGVRCPRTLAIVHDRLALESHLDGVAWDPTTDQTGVGGAARVVARLHGAPPPRQLPTHGPVQELDVALRAAEDLARLSPQLAGQARTLTDRLAMHVPPAATAVFAHGDLHIGQFLVGADGEHALCDFDRACLAPAAYDLASLRAQCLLRDPRHGAALAAAFEDDYASLRPLPSTDERGWWNACALLRAATRPFRSMRTDWPTASAQLLQGAGASLDRATTGGGR